MQDQQEIPTGSDKCQIHNVEKRIMHGYGYEPVCPECAKAEREERYLKERISAAYSRLALPKRLRDCCFANYEMPNEKVGGICSACVNFANEKKGNLIMLGGVGTGKTHLAAAICNHFCSCGLDAELTTIPEIIRDIRSTWGNRARNDYGDVLSEEDIIRKYSSVSLLVIDEIGSQYGSDSEKIIISEIINNRYNAMLPTVIIGNITYSQAESYLGKRVMDRLKHGGKILVFDWDSYRKLAQ